jgi:flagellar biosynthesis protein FliQ
METGAAIDLIREALIGALIIGTPVLLAGMVTGLIIGLLQALTQIQDQTVSFVPKILAMALVMMVCMPWLIDKMVEITRIAFQNAALVH